MKRIADTSRAALADVVLTIAPREAMVLDGLRRYRLTRGGNPTSYELLQFLQLERPSVDLNGVRPRLTALKDGRQVETTGKRICSVTGKKVLTWGVVVPAAHPAARIEQSPPSNSRQEALF